MHKYAEPTFCRNLGGSIPIKICLIWQLFELSILFPGFQLKTLILTILKCLLLNIFLLPDKFD